MIDLWQEIYGTIKRNKLRTFLTGFAVAWGIFMLIVLLGAGNGIIHAFEQNASERALNSIRLGGGWTTKSYEGLKEGRRIQMENKDLAATEKYFPDNIITAGATLRQGDVNISFGQEYINISLMGVHPNYVQSEAISTGTISKSGGKLSFFIKSRRRFFSGSRIRSLSASLSMQAA